MKNSIIRFRYSIIALLMIVINGVGALASTPWTVNPNDYRYDMTVYLDVKIDSDQMDYSSYEVAAFHGDECRGIAEPLSLGNGKECLYLRIRSNVESGEAITFRYYDVTSDEIVAVPGISIQFESNGLIGYPSHPFIVNIGEDIYFGLILSAGRGGTVDRTSGSYAEGTELTITAVPSEGYSFTKWSDGNTDNPRKLTIDDNMALEAEFTVNSYLLSIYLNDVLVSSELIEYGAKIVIEDPDVPVGTMFDGWIDIIPEYMPAHDVEIHGRYSEVSSVSRIEFDDSLEITVCDIHGRILYEKVRWANVRDKLPERIYIINGVKRLIKHRQ